MDDFGVKFAFMKLDGEMTKFTLGRSNWEDDGNGTVIVANNDYVITLNFKQVSSSDETFQKEGDLTINNSDGQTIVIPFFGECGC